MKVLSLISLMLSLTLTQAAPTPVSRPIRELCQEDLVGSWHYQYGNHNAGFFAFYREGTFRSNLGLTNYVGTWSVEDNIIIVKEKVESVNEYGITHHTLENTYYFKFEKPDCKKGKIKVLKGKSSTDRTNYNTEVILNKGK